MGCTVLYWYYSVPYCTGTELYRTVLVLFCTVLYWYYSVPYCTGMKLYPTVLVLFCTVLYWYRIVPYCTGTELYRTVLILNCSVRCGPLIIALNKLPVLLLLFHCSVLLCKNVT